mmetsp:Transcript_10476/g.38978  ORF Transcript_10476/g.38978 Transcript_10476/m.38978 type:complete len:180 (-) Transcript_10476:39-578(-)
MPSHNSFFHLCSDSRWTLFRKQIHPHPIYKFIVQFPNEHIFLFGIYIDETLELQQSNREHDSMQVDLVETSTQSKHGSSDSPQLSLKKIHTESFPPAKKKRRFLALNKPVATFSYNDQEITLTSDLRGEVKEWNEAFDAMSNNGRKQNRAWYLIIDGACSKDMEKENKAIVENWDFEKV